MSVLKVLRQKVAPELNFLFTLPPVETPLGWDCGWHGHAHALHTYFVARMFGTSADLRSGDFVVRERVFDRQRVAPVVELVFLALVDAVEEAERVAALLELGPPEDVRMVFFFDS